MICLSVADVRIRLDIETKNIEYVDMLTTKLLFPKSAKIIKKCTETTSGYGNTTLKSLTRDDGVIVIYLTFSEPNNIINTAEAYDYAK